MANQPVGHDLSSLDQRSRDVFRLIVESYLREGDPIGSRSLSRMLPQSLSPATIRNVMSDLEQLGLIHAPHVSAGRLPTQQGLRFFVDAFLEIGDMSDGERRMIEAQVEASGRDQTIEHMLTEASQMLSGMSRGAGLVLTTKSEVPLKHIEFVPIDQGRALVVIVTEGGAVENRVIGIPKGLTPSALAEATNYLNAQLRGRTLEEAKALIARELETQKAQLNELTAKVIEAGLATWSGAGASNDPLAKSLIVRGRSRLLEDVHAVEDLERIRLLFDELENKRDLVQLLGLAEEADGVRIFIGSENKLFSLSGSSVVLSPYKDANDKVIGVLGVIGPTRLNYARVIPMVDYTAKLVGRLIN